ncbi:helix-turn-helix domain-containing protein [Janibacter limosus]|uniref:TetR/AcrR family transcriptional regulator n=1 Tax=Janibacter limosus TaxID=53458 RepID=A0AC61U411_9MICO|nr:helix-turn-helix domain-containing protein [Janibacter limosus]UUZ44780.1 helix-turn-helix domain-containing protein [Janibacter limosus]
MARQRVTTTSDVVEAAAHVFARKGYRSSTIDDICLEAGVSRPTIYKYVESKPRLPGPDGRARHRGAQRAHRRHPRRPRTHPATRSASWSACTST